MDGKYTNLQKGLQDFIDAVILTAKDNLQSADKVSSGSLYNSMRSSGVKIMTNSLEIGLFQNDYGGFIDKGVSGTEKKFDTIFTYRDKMPPTKAIDRWLYDRGIAPRNKKGQFKSRSSVAFAIAKNIQKFGIAPTHYLTDAVEENKSKLNILLTQAFGLDAKATVDLIIKSNFKKK